MENIRSILLTRNTRNAARSIHKDGVRRGFETNADCYSMTRGNLEIKIWAQGARAGDPLFFSSLYTKTCTQTRPPTQPGGSAAGAAPAAHAAAAPASGARQQPLWVTHHAPGGEATIAERGAWRLDGGARRVETIAPSSPPPVILGRRPTPPCNALTLPVATVPVGAALETPAASNLRAPTRLMARLPRGERKDALDTVA